MHGRMGWVTAVLARRRRRKYLFRFGLFLLLLLILTDVLYVVTISPNWDKIASGPCPKSNVIAHYEYRAKADSSLPRLQWHPVSLSEISESVQLAVRMAEDVRFFSHPGVDWRAIRDAFLRIFRKGRADVGGSTISQQTVKNLVFDSHRSWVRKWHEMLLALWMDQSLSKRRILFIYLNIAEFGPGIYGVDAAAKHYWNVTAAQLSPAQAVELAASLPSPRRHNPKTRTERFLGRVAKINGYLKAVQDPKAETE